MEETIRLCDLYKTIRKYLYLIVLLTFFLVIITGIISYFILTPIYQTSTEILVNQSSAETGQITDLNIENDLQLIHTYSVIVKSPVILDQVVNELNLNMTVDKLAEKINVSNAEKSQIMTIAVKDENQADAVAIANMTASVFEKNIISLMNVDNVKILSPATLKENPVPIFPKPVLNMAIAALVGLMLGIGIAFLLEYLDTTIKDQQDIEEILGIQLIGVISPITERAEIGKDDKIFDKGRYGTEGERSE